MTPEQKVEAAALIADNFANHWQRGADDTEDQTPKGEAFRAIAAEVARQFAGCAVQIRAINYPQ